VKNKSKKLLTKGLLSTSLIFSMSGGFAHNIMSMHTHQAVPLSLTSTVILGIMLIFTGLFILPRMQGRHIRTLAATSLLAGIITAGVSGRLINEAIAAPPTTTNNCTITNANSTTGCPANVPPTMNIIISNTSDDDITVNSVVDPFVQRKNHSLKVVELVKGPIKRSVVFVPPPCVFPQTLPPLGSCSFNHTAAHGGG